MSGDFEMSGNVVSPLKAQMTVLFSLEQSQPVGQEPDADVVAVNPARTPEIIFDIFIVLESSLFV